MNEPKMDHIIDQCFLEFKRGTCTFIKNYCLLCEEEEARNLCEILKTPKANLQL